MSGPRYCEEMRLPCWGKMINLGRNDLSDYMRVGRAYYVAERYKSADSIFNEVLKKDPGYLDAYVYIARTKSRQEPDTKTGMARAAFQTVLRKAQSDSLENEAEIMEACGYLGYHYMMNDNYQLAKAYYERMINLDPSNNDNKTRGYIGIGQLETRMAGNQKTIEGRLPYLARATESYRKVLAYDAQNETVQTSLKYVQDFEKQVRAGINPNELKGVVRNAAGQPVANASVRVKDTAAETYTNASGSFKFEIPQSSEALLISAQGYAVKEVPVTRPLTTMTIILEQ